LCTITQRQPPSLSSTTRSEDPGSISAV
jgi:hypothetical protein